MPRHADVEDRTFRRSLLRAAGGGLLAMVVTFGITAVLTQVGRPRESAGPVVTSPAATVAPPDAEETVAPEPTTATTATSTVGGDDDGVVTVQVLDAVGSGTYAEDAAAVLRELGYEVVVVNPTPRRPATTTVLATPGHEDDAAELAALDARFAETDVSTDFNPEVDLHIIVTDDFVEP
jgi:hypothetical protein